MNKALSKTPKEALSRLEEMLRGTEHQDFFLSHRSRYGFLLELVAARYAGGKALDVGASPGHVSSLCKLMGMDLTAVDLHPSEQFPARTGRKPINLYEELSIPVCAADISREKLPFADGEFSLILFNETLEHLVGSPLIPLAEMARTLAPGGRLILTTPNAASLRNRLSFLFGRNVFTPLEVAINVSPYKCHNREYTLGEVTDLTRRAGLKIESATRRNLGEPVEGAGRKMARAVYYAATWAWPPGRSLLCVVASKP